jgi:hypothetical protein
MFLHFHLIKNYFSSDYVYVYRVILSYINNYNHNAVQITDNGEDGACGTEGKENKYVQVSIRKTKGRTQLGRPGRRLHIS